MRRSLFPIACLALGSLACDGGSSSSAEAPKKGASDPSPTAGDTEQAASPSEGPPPLPEPTPEAPPEAEGETFASPDGAVTVGQPPAERFECVEQRAEEPVATTLVKCRRTDEGAFFFMMAKTYEAPRDDIKSPKALATEVFPATYRQLFDEYEVTKSGPRTWRGREGFESEISATHGKLGPIMKRELVLTLANHVFIISAEGAPADFDAEADAIARWFETTEFAAFGRNE